MYIYFILQFPMLQKLKKKTYNISASCRYEFENNSFKLHIQNVLKCKVLKSYRFADAGRRLFP